MSALAGRWNHDGRDGAARDCRRMLAAQAMYGPHDSRSIDDGALTIGRNLYRTLPEDRFDAQPVSGVGSRYHLVADVRLDNRDELIAALGLDGAALSDAMVLATAWERWRDDIFDRLLGDYAFAVWDAASDRLILARDALGGRPLHYHVGDGFVAFASMPKGLHALADVPHAPDTERLAEFLALMPEYGSRSFFDGISRVEAGHVVSLTADGAEVRRHWNPTRETLTAPAGDGVAGLREAFDRAVAARLRGAGARVATHLSGGWDSGIVTATAARLTDTASGEVIALTAAPREGYAGGAPEGRIADESTLAAATAALHHNIRHIVVRSGGGATTDLLDRAYHWFDRPVLNVCNQQWLDAIGARARDEGANVLLTGQMGNMSISYAGLERLPELARGGRWIALLREAAQLVRAHAMRWRGVMLASVGPFMPLALWRGIHRIAGRSIEEIADYSMLNPAQLAALDITGRARAHGLDLSYRPRANGFESRLWVLQRIDLANCNKGMLAAYGIDVRDPTADRRLIEYCLALPMSAFLSGGRMRAIGAAAFADRLPAAVIAAREKGLQAADWHEGLTASRDALRLEVQRLRQIPSAVEALDLDRMGALIDDWPADGWHSRAVTRSYRQALLRGTSAGHFLRKASRSNA